MEEKMEQAVGDREDAREDKFLTFRIGNEDYGIDIGFVIEIIGIQKITTLPDTPPSVKGVINLRGKVIPVIDVRLRFGMPEREYDDRTCIIVVQIGEMIVGLIVDSVREVQDIPAAQIDPPPVVNQSAQNRYVRGMGKVGEEVKILLAVEKLLLEEEYEMLSGETEI